MKRVKSFTTIWNVEKVIYALNDLSLPFPLTISQIMWFSITFIASFMFGSIFPLNLITNQMLKHLIIPISLTYFMNGRYFYGKKPYSFFKSVIKFFFRNKFLVNGKKPKKVKPLVYKKITMVTNVER